jgi:hypothetical protein
MIGFLVGWGVFWLLFWGLAWFAGAITRSENLHGAGILFTFVSVIYLLAVGAGYAVLQITAG